MNPLDVYAQTDSVGPTVWQIIYSLIGLVAILLFFLVYRRVSGKMGSSENIRPSGGLDLMTLKKKGILTPEELERVGQAMMRQMKDKEAAERRKLGIKSAEALMLDPEVRRLEVLAAAKAKSETGKQQSQQYGESAPQAPSAAVPPQNVSPQAPQPAADSISEEELAQVELPLDVQQLVDSGLLSPEEVQNVKRRLLERRRQQ